MKSIFLTVLFSAITLVSVFAQGRKLPDISFQERSIEYANANRGYNDDNQYIDTLQDEAIVRQLAAILIKNEAIVIQIIGHTAINESNDLGQSRAQKVYEALVAEGVDSARLSMVNAAHESPTISDDILFSQPTSEEKEAVNQKNRRVEIKVVGKREE
jgi:outer membrane protein OmpA-like peptidoglycan-associated protein